MCECGCGDFHPLFKFKGEKNIVYCLELYMPCDNCNTPVGIIISKHNKQNQEMFDIKNVPNMIFNKDNNEFALKIFSINVFKKVLLEIISSIDPITLNKYLPETIDDIAQDIFEKTLDETRKE